MFGDLTSAFGFTVVLCLAPSLLIALIFPPILMRLTRPTNPPARPGDKPEPKRRNFLAAGFAFAQFYFVSLVVLVMASILFWWAFIATSGTEAAAEFAAQSFAADEAALEEIVATTPPETE
jgi:multidrug efflux pump subunit AcrB